MVTTEAWREIEYALLSLISRNRDLLEDETDQIKCAKIQGAIMAYRTMLQTPNLIIENCDKDLKSEIEKDWKQIIEKRENDKQIRPKF